MKIKIVRVRPRSVLLPLLSFPHTSEIVYPYFLPFLKNKTILEFVGGMINIILNMFSSVL